MFEIAQYHMIPQNRSHSADAMSIALVINKESMLLDPIDWPALKSGLQEWADDENWYMSIPDWTNKLFLERTVPNQSARVAQHFR